MRRRILATAVTGCCLMALSGPVKAVAFDVGTSAVTVAVIDTGISGDILPRPPVATFACARTCVPEPAGTLAARHGTQVTGVIEDAAPTASIVSFRVTDATGAVSPRAVRAAVKAAVDQGIPVVNISIALMEDDPALVTSITHAASTLFVVAAGNDGQRISTSFPVLPCMIEAANVLCVTSSGPGGRFVEGSNYSRRFVDLAALGLAVPVYSPLGTVHGNGTSLAAPAVAGAAAEILADTRCITPIVIREIITDTVAPNATLAARTVTGGSLDGRRALARAEQVCRSR
jgi:subtilisin family serine protease